MSHQGNDNLIEEEQILEEDLKDAMERYEQAKEDTRDAYKWEEKTRLDVEIAQTKLSNLRNKF